MPVMLENMIGKSTAIDRVMAGKELTFDDGMELMNYDNCLLYTSPSPRDRQKSRMPSSA